MLFAFCNISVSCVFGCKYTKKKHDLMRIYAKKYAIIIIYALVS